MQSILTLSSYSGSTLALKTSCPDMHVLKDFWIPARNTLMDALTWDNSVYLYIIVCNPCQTSLL